MFWYEPNLRRYLQAVGGTDVLYNYTVEPQDPLIQIFIKVNRGNDCSVYCSTSVFELESLICAICTAIKI